MVVELTIWATQPNTQLSLRQLPSVIVADALLMDSDITVTDHHDRGHHGNGGGDSRNGRSIRRGLIPLISCMFFVLNTN